MSVTCGFYDSSNGDRKYNAIQMGRIFDGLIGDGVFATVGNAFVVKAATGNTVNVGTGKAWFNHTWTVNDAILPIELPEVDILLDRIDAIVLEVNASSAVRQNTIKFLKGTASSTPERPSLENSEEVHQYPLCYIYRKYGTTAITQADITPMVGSTETPFVTAMLQTVSLDELLGKWQDELDQFTDDQTQKINAWIANEEGEFNNWFAGLKDVLDENTAGNLYNLIQTKADLPILTSIFLSATGWTGAESPFKQNVTIANASENSLISVQPSDEVYMELVDSGVMLLRVDNIDGTFIATAIGEKPKNDLTVQAVINLVVTSGSDPPKNSATEQIELNSESNGQSLEPVESESRSGMAFSNSIVVDNVSSTNGECKSAAYIRTGASPEVASCDGSSARQSTVIESEVIGAGIIANKQEREERIEITQPSPNGAEIILNPNSTGEKFDLFQHAPDGHDVVFNPIQFKEGITLALPVPSGVAAVANKIDGSESVKLVHSNPTGNDILFVDGSSAHFASVKNNGQANIGDGIDGNSDSAVSAKNTATPEFLSSVPASQMSTLKATSDMQPELVGFVDMLSILGMKMLWNAEAAAVIPWENPVQNGDVLSITQVYSATQNGDTLEVT